MLHVYLYHPAWNAITARYSTVAWKQIKKMYILSDATNAAECTYKWVISHFHPAFRLQHIWSSFEPAQKRYWPSNGELNAIISRKSLTNFDLFGVWLPHVPWRSWGEVRMNQQDMDFGIREYANLFENLVYTLISHVILRILTCCNRQMIVCASLATEHWTLLSLVDCALPSYRRRETIMSHDGCVWTPAWMNGGLKDHFNSFHVTHLRSNTCCDIECQVLWNPYGFLHLCEWPSQNCSASEVCPGTGPKGSRLIQQSSTVYHHLTPDLPE